jgi:hypothetical protein
MPDIANRGAQLASIDYQANRPWRVLLPPVYRYLPNEFVSSFFDKGELRLSSFAQFAKHTDEARGDTQEGQSMVSAQGGGRQFVSFVSTGHQSYVLCGSFILSKPIMERFSDCDAVIEITNVPEFALAVARQLAGFTSGVSGYCIYAANRVLVRHVGADPFPLPTDPKEGIPMDRLFAATAAASQHEDMFLKSSDYAYQAEYRLIWNIDKPTQDNVIITAPDARQFCRRVSSEEID